MKRTLLYAHAHTHTRTRRHKDTRGSEQLALMAGGSESSGQEVVPGGPRLVTLTPAHTCSVFQHQRMGGGGLEGNKKKRKKRAKGV